MNRKDVIEIIDSCLSDDEDGAGYLYDAMQGEAGDIIKTNLKYQDDQLEMNGDNYDIDSLGVVIVCQDCDYIQECQKEEINSIVIEHLKEYDHNVKVDVSYMIERRQL